MLFLGTVVQNVKHGKNPSGDYLLDTYQQNKFNNVGLIFIETRFEPYMGNWGIK